MVGQQSREPAHSLVKRSGHRSSGEAFYLRDDDTGELWSPTAQPIRDEAATYVARHGWGYSRFECTVARHCRRLSNTCRSPTDQDIAPSTAQHVEPHPAAVGDGLCGMGARVLARILGAVRHDRDRPETGAMFARNPWSAELSGRASPSPISGDARRIGRATDGNSSAATERSRARPRSPAGRPLSNNVAQVSILAARYERRSNCQPNGTVETRVLPRPRPRARRRREPDHTIAGRPRCGAVRGRPVLGRRAGAVQVKRPTGRWTSC